MPNAFDETRWAVQRAEEQLKAADSVATDLARLLVGRLRKVNNKYLLVRLKKELRNYNARLDQWDK